MFLTQITNTDKHMTTLFSDKSMVRCGVVIEIGLRSKE